MKGRSHRLQSHDAAHEDWVDGSWTVDCVCGVNFDDGEEMVNCDECGVWVHTRCSRYVKGDELFTCHKCKSKNNNRNDNEETEVAQLLVELPTTTIRLETRNAANGPSRRPFRLWTDIPREKRVHVQGIPGGDPSLFTGLSSVFTPQLWKCTGYVPKKFNFQYREFPCWDEKEEGDAVVNEVENQNTVDKGAGILFSLSKENVLATSAAALIHMRGKDEQAGCDEKVHSKQMKKWENEIAEVRHLQIGVKKDKSLLQPIVIQSGKQKSEEVGIPKDCNRKKKSRAAEKEVELNKKGLLDPKSVFTSTSDGKPLEYHEDRGSKSFRNDSQSPKNKNVMGTIFQGCESDSCTALGNKAEKPSDNLALVEYSSETLSVEMSRNIFPAGTTPDEGKGRHEVFMGFDNPTKVNLVTLSDLEHVDVGKTPVKQEGDGMLHANPDGIAEGSAGSDVKPDELATVTLEVEDSRINGDCSMFPTLQPDAEVEVADRETRQVLNCPSFTDAKEAETSNSMPENSKQNDSTISSSPLTDYKSQETVEAISESHAEKVQELSGKNCLLKQDLDDSENTILMLECPLEPKRGLGFAEEPSKSGGTNLNSPALPNTVNSNPDTKQQVRMDANSSIKDQATSSVARDDDNMSIKITKERSKSSINSMSKVPNSSKTAATYLPKKILPDSKDSLIYSSSKVSLAQNSSEAAGFPRNDSASYAQHKPSTSGLPLRSEKFVQSNSQTSSKANYTLSMNPSAPANSPAALSDEELALLLHQELNSSPRVPRVPRVRHASSLHQLASPMATSMLMKRTYSAGTKDSILRSKSRDASKDGFCQSHEPDDEDRRTNRMPSPNQRQQNKGYTTETSSKRGDSGSPTSKHSVKKNVPTISTSTANSGPSSSTEISDHHLSSMRGSPMSISDEETGTILGPVPQTLPGLIDEIMSKGKRMTYEELCNAVLPHWHNLRKHNGERYAYSSHSQAVLDCLRSRHKWARLVDRGPKTNSSRKRRKLDAEDLEDNDYGEGRARKEGEAKGFESQREDFPKGKRKARKRRRLALQGRGIKDVRKRHKSNSHTDEDIGSFSNSSEESLFSEDETQGSGGGTVGVEASATSDEEGTR